MDTNQIPNVISDNVIVTMDYTLTVDGKQIGSSKKGGPLEFIQGQHDIILGLEKQIYDMKVGDARDVISSPEDGYGKIDPDAFTSMDIADFPENVPMKPGTIFNLRDEEGGSRKARIDSINDDHVKLNFNHPLAGKDLHFQVTILELRSATPDELENGL